MTREWKWYPKDIPLKTELGDIYLNVTDAQHIYVGAPRGHAILTVRGKDYHVSMHMNYLPEQGMWARTQEPDPYEPGKTRPTSTSLYATKVDYDRVFDRDAAPTIARKIEEVITGAVNLHMSGPRGRQLRLEAQEAHVNNECMRIDEKIAELDKQMKDLEIKRLDLTLTLGKL